MRTQILYHVHDQKIRYIDKVRTVKREVMQFPTHTLLFYHNKKKNEVFMTWAVPHSKKESFVKKEGNKIVNDMMKNIFIKDDKWRKNVEEISDDFFSLLLPGKVVKSIKSKDNYITRIRRVFELKDDFDLIYKGDSGKKTGKNLIYKTIMYNV